MRSGLDVTSDSVYSCCLLSLRKPRAPSSEYKQLWPRSLRICAHVPVLVLGSGPRRPLKSVMATVRNSRPLLSLPHPQCPGKWPQFAGDRKEDLAHRMQYTQFYSGSLQAAPRLSPCGPRQGLDCTRITCSQLNACNALCRKPVPGTGRHHARNPALA